MNHETSHRKKISCANCGKPGHEFRFCTEPIISFGIINVRILDETTECFFLREKFSTNKSTYFRITSRKYPETKCYISDNIKLYESQDNNYRLDNDNIPFHEESELQKFWYYKNRIQFMMVSRKFSLGFVEFVRGKYDTSNAKEIMNLFEQMTEEEIKFIDKHSYDDILYTFLNRHKESREEVLNRIYEGKYSNEYCEAKIKFNLLLNPHEDVKNDVPWNLHFYTRHIKPKWKVPEWGFPKGRRDKRSEENLSCACREFEEESGYKPGEYIVLNKIEPIEEKLTGTNGVNYKHIYYLSINNTNRETKGTNYDTNEIGDIRWFNYEEAINHIRPYHVDKKKILTRVYLFIINYLIHCGMDPASRKLLE